MREEPPQWDGCVVVVGVTLLTDETGARRKRERGREAYIVSPVAVVSVKINVRLRVARTLAFSRSRRSETSLEVDMQLAAPADRAECRASTLHAPMSVREYCVYVLRVPFSQCARRDERSRLLEPRPHTVRMQR